MIRTCSRCSESFSLLAELHGECVECQMAGGDGVDDAHERARSRARQLVTAYRLNRALIQEQENEDEYRRREDEP
jgi:hypothetical protein